MAITIRSADGGDGDFLMLIEQLDGYLNDCYGALQKQYNGYNRAADVTRACVCYVGGVPAACGAIKEYDGSTAELKRMFVKPEFRRMGLAKAVIAELEKIARSMGYSHLVLETGKKQAEAISLYTGAGFKRIENYGPYAGMENSVCFKKRLI